MLKLTRPLYSLLVVASAAGFALALDACSDDGGTAGPKTDAAPPRDATSVPERDAGVDGAASPPDSGLDAEPPRDVAVQPDAPTVFDAGPSYSRCPLASSDGGAEVGTDGGARADGGVWTKDFTTGDIADIEGDDTGDGDYKYPADIDPPVDGGPGRGGIADLTKFNLSYSAATQELSVTVAVKRLTDNTRVGLVVWDEAHFPKADAGPLSASELEWAMTGNELRIPNWNAGGVTFLLAKPSAGNSTFDLAVKRNLSGLGVESRPDNAVYIERGGWLGCDGKPKPSGSRFNILELDVRTPVANELTFKLPTSTLAGEIDLSSPHLYAVLYSYVLIDRSNNSDIEFGALEITPELGGLPQGSPDEWREPDTYDIGFVSTGSQSALLTAPPQPDGGFTADDATKLVVVKDIGKGVLAIDTRQ
jgi:hypothetical protein